jgi:hypothetical protein
MGSGIDPNEDGPASSRASRNWDLVLHAAVISAPVIVFTSIIVWFSQNRISPNPTVEASAANPLGLLTSNFVYDGSINIENIVASSVFLLIVCLYYPKQLRIFMVYLLPFIAVAAGALAEFTAISSPYVSLPLCAQSCSFYGMSGVASATVGFTFASFLIAFGLIILQRMKGRLSIKQSTLLTGRIGLTSQVILVSAFVVYLVLLLVFSGVIALPSSPSSTSSSSSSPPPPPAILTQAPPVLLVHSASLVYGFLLCLATFVQVNRRYHIFAPPVRQDRD